MLRGQLTVMRNFFILIFCVAWVALVPPARAQWLCHLSDSADIGQGSPLYGSYFYTALSCKGNNAVAAADVDALVGEGYYLAFLISTDGGITWIIENQGLPAATWDHQPFIRTIDQIDSLHTIAFGDSDLLVRTTDAGATWQELASPTNQSIEDISFSDPMNGILVAADTIHGTYVTTNGGVDWSPAPFTRDHGWQCHDYGNGMYRIFEYGSGTIYTTKDNWNTIDSTASINSDAHYVFTKCSFGVSDTLFACGNRSNVRGQPFPCIARTTDGGRLWASVYDVTSLFIHTGWVSALSDLSRDTIVAGISGSIPNTILWSANRGETWQFDTLIFHDPNYPGGGGNWGVGLNSEGDLLGAYTLSSSLALAPALIIGQHATAGVTSNHGIFLYAKLFPNPAATSLTLTNAYPGNTIQLFDILGRDVLGGTVPGSGTLTLDVSQLPRGIYVVIMGHGKTALPLGKIILTGE